MTDALGAKAPKYHRIASEIRSQVRSGHYQPGERLPAETALAERFGVSVLTLRQAIGVLRAEGVLESRHGVGTFVREERRLQRRSRHRYGVARGRPGLPSAALRQETTFVGRVPLPVHIAPHVDLDPGVEVVIRRRSLHDPDTGRLEELGASYLPVAVAGGTCLEEPGALPRSLFLCVEELTGRRYTRARDQWIARPARAEESAAFDLVPGAPVLHVVHVVRDEHGDLLEASESVWPAERIMIIDDYPLAVRSERDPDVPDA